jgi:hypothetical protein
MPSASNPSGSLFDSIFGPLLPLLGSAWWVVLHLLLPAALIFGVIGMVFAGFTGDRAGMARARGAVLGVPMALFFASAAVLAGNWIIGHY